jgi:hypothetical protein
VFGLVALILRELMIDAPVVDLGVAQDWRSRWSTPRTKKSTIWFCTDRRYGFKGYGFKAKFPLILCAQPGEMANPRLWYSIAHHRTGWPWGLAESTQVSLCRRSHP